MGALGGRARRVFGVHRSGLAGQHHPLRGPRLARGRHPDDSTAGPAHRGGHVSRGASGCRRDGPGDEGGRMRTPLGCRQRTSTSSERQHNWAALTGWLPATSRRPPSGGCRYANPTLGPSISHPARADGASPRPGRAITCTLGPSAHRKRAASMESRQQNLCARLSIALGSCAATGASSWPTPPSSAGWLNPMSCVARLLAYAGCTAQPEHGPSPISAVHMRRALARACFGCGCAGWGWNRRSRCRCPGWRATRALTSSSTSGSSSSSMAGRSTPLMATPSGRTGRRSAATIASSRRATK